MDPLPAPQYALDNPHRYPRRRVIITIEEIRKDREGVLQRYLIQTDIIPHEVARDERMILVEEYQRIKKEFDKSIKEETGY